MKFPRTTFCVFLFSFVQCASSDTTVNSGHPYAYSANAGWINARGDITGGAVLGQSFCSGFLWSANCGWFSLGNGPTNGWQYSNVSSNDWGVNHDGEGRLAGFAYGANIGWITFEQTHGQPRIDLRTGAISGYAWGANVGWIGFSNSLAFVQSTLDTGADTDLDGIPDPWERRRTGGLTELGAGDADDDHVPDVDEYAADTNPQNDEQLEITALNSANGTNFVSWASRPTRLYHVEANQKLPSVWTNAGTGLMGPPASSPSQIAINQPGTNVIFYRVRAVVPLSE